MPIAIAGNQITYNDGTVQTSANVPTSKLLLDTGSLGFRNMVINGDMRIDQRNAGVAQTNVTTNAYSCDRFRLAAFAGATRGVYTLQQSTDAPPGFSHSQLIRVTSVATNTTDNGFRTLAHNTEANNTTHLNYGTNNAKTCTLSFWVKCNQLTGTFPINLVALPADGGSWRYLVGYTINQINTWEYKTIVFPGPVQGQGVYPPGTQRNITIDWVLGAGIEATGNPTGWTFFPSGAAIISNRPGWVNMWSTLNTELYITGVQFEVGSTATPFEYRPIGTELALCQRYYERINNAFGLHQRGNDSYAIVYYKEFKRIVPTVRVFNPITETENQARFYYCCPGTTIDITVGVGSPVGVGFPGVTQDRVIVGQPGYVPPSTDDAQFIVNLTVDADY